jgi:UDP-N-acetylglucosamine 2-epimerase (non-hydrolysing)
VVQALRAAGQPVELLSTGQHREMLDQALSCFGLRPDIDLGLMARDQSLSELVTRVVTGVDTILRERPPDLLVVQGDTTTTFASSLAAFHRRVPVAHVEAGLRSFDRAQPFPEEVNRRLTTVLTDLHLAPTPLAKERLLAEGIARERIAVTGNTVVDALAQIVATLPAGEAAPIVAVPADARVVLATIHRRESWGAELEGVCQALGRLVDRFADLHVILPVHLNPNVREPVHRSLGGRERVHLLPPVDYLQFVHLLQRATLVVTDSGGVQEEAPSLGKPLLLLRRVTERPEAFDAGAALLVGTDPDRIVVEASRLLEDPSAYRAMTGVPNPYGDGRAAGRVVEAIERFLAGEVPVLEASREFRPGAVRGSTPAASVPLPDGRPAPR